MAGSRLGQIFFRTDASYFYGTGHLMRCLTLADALRERVCKVSFVCRELPGNMIEYVETKGYKVYRLPYLEGEKNEVSGDLNHSDWLGVDWRKDALETKTIIKKDGCTDWLVVDNYALDRRWEEQMRPFAKRIMVIDDSANRRHDCDILLDQNYNINVNRYNGFIPDRCIKLLGTEYALLRPQFRKARESLKKDTDKVKRILVFMGGADPTNETGKVLKAVKLFNRDNIAVDVVIGASNPFKNEIETIVKQMPNTTCYFGVNNMAELMTVADLGIGASGTSTWERCCLGLPSLVMILADNQKDIAEELEKEGVVVNIGWHEDVTEKDIRDALKHLLIEPEKRKSMGLKGKEMVDGNGAKRVVEKMIFSTKVISV